MFKKETVKSVLSLALPAVGEMILYMMIWVFDTMMVGKYGGNVAVSTVGLSSEIMTTFVNIFITVGVSVGITSIVARRFGAKDFKLAEEYASIGFFAGVIISFLISIINFLFCGQILKMAGASSSVLTMGIMFMRIASISIFFNMVNSLLNSIMRGYGNTITPLVISIVINIVNILLDYTLIFGNFGFPEFGVKGAAIATTIAQITGFLFASVYTVKKSRIKINLSCLVNLSKNKLRELLRLSIPSSFQEGAFDISRLICTFMIMHIGTVAFASNQIATTIESISFMPGWGFAVAATTLVGHKVGEKDYKGANEYAYTCTLLGILVMCICSILFLTIPHVLISLFIKSSESQVIDVGAKCLMIASVEQPFMAMSMIFGGAFKGHGDTKTPFIISFISSWIIRLPLMYIFIYVLKLSVAYVWCATAVQWFFDGTMLFLLYRKRCK